MTTKTYLKTFFEEKDLPAKTFEVEHDGTTHFVENDFVIEVIKKSSPDEQTQIANIIRRIDFANGDVNHFLEHLANGYVKTNY